MKIVIAPDSFKESMSAYEASLAIEKGIRQYHQNIETLIYPLADGGEGTLETLVMAMNGNIEYYSVTGPIFNKVKAPIGYMNDCAIIECAKVCGLELVKESQKDPNHTTTYGLGELIKHALDRHVHTIMVCLGGSATNDGGIGMLNALGVKFQNLSHQDVLLTMAGLKDIASIDISQMDSRINKVKIIGVCDVNNPLCGIQGATYVYAHQKGLDYSRMKEVDEDMSNYARLSTRVLDDDYQDLPGAGAAGGLGFALMAFCHALLQPGFQVVSEMIDLEKAIASCDKVIVGEGKIDAQTQYGKTPYGVLQIAQKYHKDVYAFAGKVEDHDVLRQLGFQNVYAISPTNIPLQTALKQGKTYLQECVFQHMEEIINEI